MGLMLVVDNTRNDKKTEALHLLSNVAAAPGGSRMLRGVLSLMAPTDPNKAAALAQNLINGIEDTGQLEAVVRVLRGYPIARH